MSARIIDPGLPLDTDYLDYYPLQDGQIPISSARTTKLSALSGDKGKIFQIGVDAEHYINNKKELRKTFPIDMFYKNNLRMNNGIKHVTDFLVKTFEAEGIPVPRNADGYVDYFDALVSQVPEDIAIITLLDDGDDLASVLHLFAPSDWSVEGAIAKSFGQIHQNVRKANGSLVIKNPEGMVRGLIGLPEPVQRVGSVSFRPSNLVCRHPALTPPDEWFWDDLQPVFIRFERQVVVPFPQINSFMLTVRSYYNNLLDPKRIKQAQMALDNPSPDVYHKVFFKDHKDNVREFFNKRV